MRTLKIFIGVTGALFLVALAAGVYVWFKVQEYEKAVRTPDDLRVKIETQAQQNESNSVLE